MRRLDLFDSLKDEKNLIEWCQERSLLVENPI